MCLINYSFAYISAHAHTTAANDSKHIILKGQSGVIFFALRIISLRRFEKKTVIQLRSLVRFRSAITRGTTNPRSQGWRGGSGRASRLRDRDQRHSVHSPVIRPWERGYSGSAGACVHASSFATPLHPPTITTRMLPLSALPAPINYS